MNFAVQHIDHVELYVRDIPASARWYREVLGLELVKAWDPQPWFIGRGETCLALFRADIGAPPPVAGHIATPLRFNRVAFRTDRDGFETAQKHLHDHGVTFRGPIDHEVAFSIYFTDPDGHPLEITWYPVSQTKGVVPPGI